jgi:hydroxyquinol 1,2-dioxygenase
VHFALRQILYYSTGTHYDGAFQVMKELDPQNITEVVLDQMSSTPDVRLREVVGSLVKHLHNFVREVELTPEELSGGLRFLTDVGHMCTDKRQEFILLSEVLGVETLVYTLADRLGEEHGTATSILGPFYMPEVPTLELGTSIVGERKPSLAFYGQVTDAHRKPIRNASVEIWQTDEEGLYDVQRPDYSESDLRGRFYTDNAGMYYLKSILPLGYSIPMDGPVGQLVKAQHRHGMRPAHVHYIVSAPGFKSVTTAIYLKDDPYLESDTVFGVTESLVGAVAEHDPSSPIPGLPALRFDFQLRSGDCNS